MRFKRVVLLLLDSVGIGEMPDAAAFGDAGRDTLGHVAASRPLKLPHLVKLGLASHYRLGYRCIRFSRIPNNGAEERHLL